MCSPDYGSSLSEFSDAVDASIGPDATDNDNDDHKDTKAEEE